MLSLLRIVTSQSQLHVSISRSRWSGVVLHGLSKLRDRSPERIRSDNRKADADGAMQLTLYGVTILSNESTMKNNKNFGKYTIVLLHTSEELRMPNLSIACSIGILGN